MFTSVIQANKPIQITSKIEVKNEYNQLSEKILNVSNKYITFTINNQSISLNEKPLMWHVLKSVQKSNPKDTQAIDHWKDQEKIIQLSATFNRAFDVTRDAFANRYSNIAFKLNIDNKMKIYNQVNHELQFGDYEFQPNAAQKSLEHILRDNAEIKLVVQLLASKNNISDSKTISYIYNHIISTINNELCLKLFPGLPLNEIQEYTERFTSEMFYTMNDIPRKTTHWQNYYPLPASRQTIV